MSPMSVQGPTQRNMKLLLFVSMTVLALQACSARITPEETGKLSNYAKDCIRESGVDVELVVKLLHTGASIDRFLAENEGVKPYLVCLYKKMGLINAEGEVQKEALKEHLSKDFTDAAKVDKIVTKCAEKKDAVSETANEMRKCVATELEPECHGAVSIIFAC